MGNHKSMAALTGLRGLAALWVLMYHTWVYSVPKELSFTLFEKQFYGHVFISLGWSGVQIFFVLSAFLLTLPFARANAGLAPKPHIKSFLIRRLARVFPAYYAQFIILVAISYFLHNLSPIPLEDIPEYALMLFIPPPIGIGTPSLNGVWWTLPIELSFYFALPLLALFVRWRYLMPLFIASVLCMFLWRFYIMNILQPSSALPSPTLQLPGSMDSFGIGMIGAILHVHFIEQRKASDIYHKTLIILSLTVPFIFYLLGVWMAHHYKVYWSHSLILYTWTPIFSLAILTLVLTSTRRPDSLLNVVFGNKPLMYLGMISYGIYLWHPPIASWLQATPIFSQFTGYKFPYLFLSTFALTLLAAAISWHLIEERCINIARGLNKHKEKKAEPLLATYPADNSSMKNPD